MSAGDKRPASKAILRNRGQIAARPRENRNPRLRQRRRYERAVKRLAGCSRSHTPCLSAYEGEHGGIRSDISKSAKFR